MKKLEYIIALLVSLAGLEFGLLYALYWNWSGFKWSPFGYETCGLEVIVFLFFVWPSFLFAVLLRLGLLLRWKYPHCVWYLPLALCGITSSIFLGKSLEMGILCIAGMVFLPLLDWYGIRHAGRRISARPEEGK